jgi:hypothetical protein
MHRRIAGTRYLNALPHCNQERLHEALDEDEPRSRDNFRALVDPETALDFVAIVETAERLANIEEMRTLIRQLAAYAAAV